MNRTFPEYTRELIVHDSSNISTIRYDPVKGTMLIKFSNGSLYNYIDVVPTTFGALCSVESVGSYFNNIKKSLKGERIN